MNSTVPLRRYETAVSLSAGGTAEIYKAYDPRLQRYVALKFLRREDPALVERMFREARAQARLEHDGICKVYEVGELDGRPYIAMQYIDGVELGVAAADMTLEDKVRVMIQVAEAVHAAHKEGLIHRDLKPANIMVQMTEDGQFKPIVVDFGLVWEHENESMTQAGQVLGTPPYLAPEQVEGRRDKLDRRTDVYGLGATLYHLLSGRPPFEGTRSVELLMKTVHEDPEPLRRVDPTIPPDLETIAAKCLEKERQRRYDSAQALGADLRRFLDGDPIEARPASTIYRLQKTIRKHRALVSVSIIAATLLLFSIAAILFTRWQADKRLEFEQRYAQIGKDVDWTMRVEYMSSPHDIVPAKTHVRKRIAELEKDLETVGALGHGPVHYAIGRSYQVLLEDDEARHHLEEAWKLGYRTPEVAYGLGLLLGRQYDDRLRRAKNHPDKGMREARLSALEKTFRKPAMEYLLHGRENDTVAVEYVEALLAFHDKEYDAALAKIDAAIKRLPWLYEAHILEGDLLIQRGMDEWLDGETEAAWSSFRQAEPAYQRAIASAGSDPRAYLGLCESALSMMRLEMQSPGENLPFYFEKARNGCDQARQIDAELATPYIREAIAHRLWGRHLTWKGENPIEILNRGRELARKGVELSPKNHRAHTILGTMHLQQGEYHAMRRDVDPTPILQSAAQSFERALELDPNNATILNVLGSTRLQVASYEVRQGRPESAVPWMERGIEDLKAGLAIAEAFDLHHNLGNAYDLKAGYEAGRGEDYLESVTLSIHHLSRSLEINQDQDWALLELGDGYGSRATYHFATGGDPFPDLEMALQQTHRAIEINPTVSEYYNRLIVLNNNYAFLLSHEGRDPSEKLAQARKWIAELDQRVDNMVPYGQRLLTESIAIRWALKTGTSPHDSIAAADEMLERVEAFDRDMFYYVAVIDYLIWRGSWELLKHPERAQETVARGLQLTRQALEINPDFAAMVSNLGCLLVLQAQLEDDPERRLERLTEAEATLEKSLVLNRWLVPEIEPWLVRARSLAGKGPRVEELTD